MGGRMSAVNPILGAENGEQWTQPTPSHPQVLGLAESLTAQPQPFLPPSLPRGGRKRVHPNHSLTHPRTVGSALSWAGAEPRWWAPAGRFQLRSAAWRRKRRQRRSGRFLYRKFELYILVTGREKRGIRATVQGPQGE